MGLNQLTADSGELTVVRGLGDFESGGAGPGRQDVVPIHHISLATLSRRMVVLLSEIPFIAGNELCGRVWRFHDAQVAVCDSGHLRLGNRHSPRRSGLERAILVCVGPYAPVGCCFRFLE